VNLRFVKVLSLFAILAGAFAGVAQALDFDDEDPEPPKAEVGLVYHYEIGTHAGCLPHKVTVGSGEIPPGLKLSQLNDHTALVSGVATNPGIFSAWLFLTDCSGRSAETVFTFEVWVRRWGIATSSLTPATAGSPYSFKLQAEGIPSKVTYQVTAGSLPAGLTLGSDGTISGTATAAGSSTFTVGGTAVSTDPASAGTRVDSRQFTLNVVAPLNVRLSRRVAEVGVGVRSSLTATGGQAPYTWSAASALPAGLAISPNGAITGTPRKAGAVAFTARVTDAGGATKDVQVSLIVRPRLAIATKFLPSGAAGSSYSATVKVRGGAGGLRWSMRGGPAGLRIDGTGRITGVPRASGTFRVTLRARDALGASSSKTFVLTVR
jgi:large repetitive protein